MTEKAVIIDYAVFSVGPDARPTSTLRVLTDGKETRLQQIWRGTYGAVWCDVPLVSVTALPPRLGN